MLTKTLIKQLEVFNDNRCTNDPEISALYSFIKETVQEFKEGNLVTGELKCKEAAVLGIWKSTRNSSMISRLNRGV